MAGSGVMSRLQQSLAEYLRLRRALGFKLEREGRWLPRFIDFLEHRDSDRITTSLAVRWAMASPSGSAPSMHARLRMVRGFARYLASHDPATELPPYERLPAVSITRRTPYIYTEDEIGDLIAAAQSLSHLKGATYATLLGLLAATGMRIGEAIALDRRDIDWRRESLIVRQDKRRRSRDLVLHPTTIAALRAYAAARDRALPYPSGPSFFVSLAGTRLNYKNVHFGFLRLVRQASLDQRRPRPRLHDLRHTFAVTTLKRWYREDVDVDARLPTLSTYLGHVAPASTYWYLTATPELLLLAKQRTERWSS